MIFAANVKRPHRPAHRGLPGAAKSLNRETDVRVEMKKCWLLAGRRSCVYAAFRKRIDQRFRLMNIKRQPASISIALWIVEPSSARGPHDLACIYKDP
jgi:hypothetical protein